MSVTQEFKYEVCMVPALNFIIGDAVVECTEEDDSFEAHNEMGHLQSYGGLVWTGELKEFTYKGKNLMLLLTEKQKSDIITEGCSLCF